MKLRIICKQELFGAAANIGGSVESRIKTFDIECPDDLAAWIRGSNQWESRWIDGAEVIDD